MICTSSGWDDSQAPQLCVLFFFFPPSALFACCFQLTAYRSASCYGARGVIHTIRLKENSTIVDSASFRCLWLLNVYPDGFLVKLTFFRSPSSSAQCQWLAVWLGRGCKRALLVWRKIKKKKICVHLNLSPCIPHALPFIFTSRCKRGCKLKGWKAYTIKTVSTACWIHLYWHDSVRVAWKTGFTICYQAIAASERDPVVST